MQRSCSQINFRAHLIYASSTKLKNCLVNGSKFTYTYIISIYKRTKPKLGTATNIGINELKKGHVTNHVGRD